MAENLIYTDRDGTLLSDYEVAHWADYSECGPETAELFFANENELKKIRDAKRLCAACKVAQICLQNALDNNEKIGIWGGKTEKERGVKRPKYDRDEDDLIPSEPDTNPFFGEATVESVEFFDEPSEYPLAGDWLTEGGIADFIGKSRTWLRPRITSEHRAKGEDRISNDMPRVRFHYPPEVAWELKIEADIENGTYLSLHGLATAVGRDRNWVIKRLPYIAFQSEMRTNSVSHQSTRYYHPDTVQALLGLPLDILRYPIPGKDNEGNSGVELLY